MKNIIIILLLGFTHLYGQDYRDSIVGTYNCEIKRAEYYPPNTFTTVWYSDSIYVLKDTIDMYNVVFFDSVFCNDPVIINLPCSYEEQLDEDYNFTNQVYGFESQGTFYIHNDSLYFENNAEGVFEGYGYIRYSYYCNKLYLVNVFTHQTGSLVSVFPNPANSYVSFVFNFQKGTINDMIEVRNLTGQLKAAIPLKKIKGKVVLDISMYLPGIYFYSVMNAGSLVTGKFVVAK